MELEIVDYGNRRVLSDKFKCKEENETMWSLEIAMNLVKQGKIKIERDKFDPETIKLLEQGKMRLERDKLDSKEIELLKQGKIRIERLKFDPETMELLRVGKIRVDIEKFDPDAIVCLESLGSITGCEVFMIGCCIIHFWCWEPGEGLCC